MSRYTVEQFYLRRFDDPTIHEACRLIYNGSRKESEAIVYAALRLEEQLRRRERQILYMIERGATLPPSMGIES